MLYSYIPLENKWKKRVEIGFPKINHLKFFISTPPKRTSATPNPLTEILLGDLARRKVF